MQKVCAINKTFKVSKARIENIRWLLGEELVLLAQMEQISCIENV